MDKIFDPLGVPDVDTASNKEIIKQAAKNGAIFGTGLFVVTLVISSLLRGR